MEYEKKKLINAVSEFSEAMSERLIEKYNQGFYGWDERGFSAQEIPWRLRHRANKVFDDGPTSDPKDLVDIANFAMFLHRRLIGENDE